MRAGQGSYPNGDDSSLYDEFYDEVTKRRNSVTSELPLARLSTRRRQTLFEGRKVNLPWLKGAAEGEESDLMSWSKCAGVFLASSAFQLGMAAAIAVNAIVIGLETDIPEFPHWDFIESCFLFLFTSELSARLWVTTPSKFFKPQEPDFTWNIFDFFVVSSGIVDDAYSFLDLQSSDGDGSATLFRVFRLLRVLRIFKVVRFLKQLYLICHGFLDAVQAIVWVMVLMGTGLYICSIILVRTVGHTPQDEHFARFLDGRFGTIGESMLSLFETMTYPNMQEYQDLLVTHPCFILFIVGFIIFGSYGMIALLTGVINQSMAAKSQLRIEEQRLGRDAKRQELGGKIIELFHEADINEYGKAHQADIQCILPYVRILFETHYVRFSTHDLENIMDVVEVDEWGCLSMQSFSQAVLSLAEDIRPLSLAELHYAMVMANSKAGRCYDALREMEEQEALDGEKMENVFSLVAQVAQRAVMIKQRLDICKARGIQLRQRE